MKIQIVKTNSPKPKPDQSQLGFGQYFADHMFIMDYDDEEGWHSPRIVPYSPISIDPAATCFHYGQLIFEGMKAYRSESGSILLFRPKDNFERFNESSYRMCMPQMDQAFLLDALCELLKLDADWIPEAPGASLYIRPFVISTDTFLGVHPSSTYRLMIILSPVGSYYKGDMAPIRIFVEDQFVRSVKGGTGSAKCAGNYGAALLSQKKASEQGCHQVLWLDGIDRKKIEEVGSTNVFFVMKDEVVTPALNGSILSGITRKSVIQLLKSWGIPVTERVITIDEIINAHITGNLIEAFTTGTAAVITPIGALKYQEHVLTLCQGEIGDLTQKIYDVVTGIQFGKQKDCFGWIHEVK